MNESRTGRPAAGGFTLVEMMTAMLASSIMVLGVMTVLASNQKEYNQTYQRVNGATVREAQEARSVFDLIVRKSSVRSYKLGSANEYVEVYWYAGASSAVLDRYTRFYLNGTDLVAETGQLTPGTFNHALNNNPTIQVLAHHVRPETCKFTQFGATISMALVIDDGRLDLPLVTTATRHNE
jgi:prepilin-type N-terminal cleavage/methylation domain-containing protein